MATQLSPDNAQLAIGKAVRVRDRSQSQSGMMGTLVAVQGDYGLVRANGNRHQVQKIELRHLQYDTTANGAPLPQPAPKPAMKPVRVPEPTTMEARQQRKEAGRDELKAALAEAELHDFGDFAGKVRKAAADVAVARQMMNDMAAQHAREMEAMREKHKAAEVDAADQLRVVEGELAALKSKASALLTLFEKGATV